MTPEAMVLVGLVTVAVVFYLVSGHIARKSLEKD